ncbi:MAG TPA: hypothetical protein PLD25_32625 [Chloroflexota bacterium]|nr:hypothetical protein [Chloroflexota bacterium]HUM67723.1 hypothetical protein [Chloroflexota bacterium]
MAKRLLALVRGERIANKSAKGKPAYAQMKGLMNYIAYGRYEDHPSFAQGTSPDQEAKQRGLWLDHTGKTTSHEEALRWAKDKVHQYGCEYTYQLLLSTRYGGLVAEDFNHVLQQGSDLSGVREWRMMVHEDTGNQHAHVILLRREKLSNARYKEWQQQMQAELEQLQAERRQERQLETEIASALDAEQLLEAAPELARPEQAQRQGWEMEL